LGREILAKEGFAVQEIAGQGLPRALSFGILTFPIRFVQGWIESRRLLKKFRPDWILAMGGYLSVPVVVNARMLGLRVLLQEQNVFPGLANRFLSRWADSVAVSFQESVGYLKGKNVWVSGLPIRPEIGRVTQAEGRKRFGLAADQPTYLIFGGSLGAQRLNSLAVEVWPLLLQKGRPFQVIHVTGTQDFERVRKLYRSLNFSAQVLPYCHEMAHAYAAATAVVCRAGASTVAELLAAKRRALLVPYPYASNDHQVYNARVVEKAGLGRIIADADLSPAAIAQFLEDTAPDIVHSAVSADLPDAAARLAAHLTSLSS
jgi:UDP-N-acetylglucosamine--N-acetylmuramyl-(pentapeptide) pyrophosphoryl-undecaprenol N-acetylglucosamine transferase